MAGRPQPRSQRIQGFADRIDAGKELAADLLAYRAQNALVLAIPRGGVPVAVEVAEALDADLDLIVAHKLGAPGQPELAIGAVTANGGVYVDEDAVAMLGVTSSYLAEETARQSKEARARELRLRGDMPRPTVRGRVAIVVDDGLATGATMRAALRSASRERPRTLIAAVPVGSVGACEMLQGECDAIVCLLQPEPFVAVGLYYEHFETVTDDQVAALLREAAARRQLMQPPAA